MIKHAYDVLVEAEQSRASKLITGKPEQSYNCRSSSPTKCTD